MAEILPTNSPLFNHLVLEKVLNYLEFSDLKTFRLVCIFWHQVSSPYFVSQAKIYLEGTSLEQLVSNESSSANSLRLIPFEYYTIKINSLLSTNDGVKILWSTIHNNIKYLTLHVTTVYAKKELKWLLLYNLPLLKKVKIFVMKYWGTLEENLDNSAILQEPGEDVQTNSSLQSFQLSYLGSMSWYGYEEGGNEFSFPIPWIRFFRRFSSLSHLALIGVAAQDVAEMIESFGEVAAGSNTPLKNLEILDENSFPEIPNDEHLGSLANLSQHNHFESLHLEISPLTTITILSNLLENNADTLKTLRLRRYPHPYLAMMPITLAIELQHVAFLEISDSLTPSLSFLPHMPALKTLHIILRDYRNLPACEIIHNTPNPQRVSHGGVTNLYIEPPLISRSCIEKLAICFPALETLQIRLSNEMMHELCTQAVTWKKLNSLHITSWDGLTDEGITGISCEILKFWGGYSSFEARKHRKNPSIGNIKSLTSLTIEMWADYENHISDWSVYYGILDLTNLQHVTLIRTEISNTAFKAIPVKKKVLVD
ncbi:unnamed protein product [Orchesella dallaii]|uniref:F-box domain-containing protein n=1 Tax=Orchesella dallaii TaxID=48710 RepID=A0ABP1S2L7_9HEXA